MANWETRLKSGLRTILVPEFGPDKTEALIEGKNSVYWINAFTHETYDVENNYEDLEHLGDRILKGVFAYYLNLEFPHFSKKEYTDLDVAWMSKMKQGELANKMRLSELIRTKDVEHESYFNLTADVFESFFGALFLSAEDNIFGSGFSYCFNMLVGLMPPGTIDPTKDQEAPKTATQQIFKRFQLGNLMENVQDNNKNSYTVTFEAAGGLANHLESQGESIIIATSTDSNKSTAENQAMLQTLQILESNKYNLVSRRDTINAPSGGRRITFTIKLTQNQLDFLKGHGIAITDNEIGVGAGKTKKEAESRAYASAFNYLKSLGVSTQWAEEKRAAEDLENPKFSSYINRLKRKYTQDGYDMVKFNIPHKSTNVNTLTIQLQGRKKQNNSFVLLASKLVQINNIDPNYTEAKLALIRDYLKISK